MFVQFSYKHWKYYIPVSSSKKLLQEAVYRLGNYPKTIPAPVVRSQKHSRTKMHSQKDHRSASHQLHQIAVPRARKMHPEKCLIRLNFTSNNIYSTQSYLVDRDR